MVLGTASESDASLLAVGDPIELVGDGPRGAGVISSILATVDAATRRVPVEAQLKNDGQSPLRAGSFARTQARARKEVAVLRLPASALRPGSQNEVMVVKAGTLHARRVLFLTESDGTLVVRAGLAPDEVVLKAPSSEARDGDAVAVAGQ